MTTETIPSKEQLQILQHSMGYDKYGRGGGFRNHFVTDSTSPDGVVCESLCDDLLMSRGRAPSDITGGMQAYHVTAAGEQAIFEHSAVPPKVTRSQQRYQKWLDGPADVGVSFADWIGAKRKRDPVYFLQNVNAGCVGNSPLFWKQGDSGYTAVITEARKFTPAEADEVIRGSRGTHSWKRWKIRDVMKAAITVCDIQLLNQKNR